MSELTRKRAVGELMIASSLWGFSFIAVRWALEGFSPYWVTALRFLIAFVTAWPILYFVGKREGRESDKALLTMAILPGMLLGMTFVLQHAGLVYTTVTKNAFITTLYVVFVPFLDWLFFGRKVHPLLGLYIAMALAGAQMICQVDLGFTDWNKGDALTLASAIVAAIHILAIERVARKIKSPLRFNVYQCLAGAALMLPLALMGPSLTAATPPPLAWLGVFILGHGVCLVAFTIQVRTQQVLPPSVVSMFFLLESPIATVLAWLLLGETLTTVQMGGAFLILISAFLTLRLPAPKQA